MLEEILRSCSNTHIAAAAVASIGGAFALRVGLLARSAGSHEGAYVARLVQRFALDASTDERDALVAALRRSDQPILLGLQLIVCQETGAKTLDNSRPALSLRKSLQGCDACAA